jgi:glutathione S-transferase
MEPVLFYGVPQGCSFGSIVALEWLGEPYRLCRIEMMERPWPPAFEKINPRMLTPALLTEDGAPLTESLAILQHIASRRLDAGSGFAQGTREFDRLNQMLSYLTTNFFSSFSPLWTIYETEGLTDAQKDLLRRMGEENVRKECAYVDGVLAGSEWLLGARRTVADAYMAGVARWAEYHKLFDIEVEYPHFARYLKKLRSDPAVRFAAAIEKGETSGNNGSFKGHVALDEVIEAVAA